MFKYRHVEHTLLFDHITVLALYMISHHITDIMIGSTLPSMLVIIYTRHQHTSLGRQRWRAPRHISTRRRVVTQKQTNRKHRRDGRITQLTAGELIGLGRGL